MSYGISGTYYPWGPFGSTFWGGFWAPPPGINIGVSDITGESHLTAEVRDYSSIQVSWQQPHENYDLYVIVRSAMGFPITLTEGLTIQFGTRSDNVTSIIDGELAPGFYYYSMFVRMTSATPQWARVGQTFALVPVDHQSGTWMFSLLPEWYQVEDEKTPGHPTDIDMESWGQLHRFLELLGRQYDNLRAEIDSLLNVYDPRITRADLLEYFANMFGFPYEPHIGYAQLRSLMDNWFQILETKGTLPGIETFVESITGYSADVSLGSRTMENLLLTTDDSEGKTTIGFWQRDTTGREFPATSPGAGLQQVTPAAPYTSSVTTAIRVTADATHRVVVVDSDVTSANTVKLTAIPVVASTTYDYQIAFRAFDVLTTTPSLYAYYYTAAGAYISQERHGGNPFDNTAWTVSSTFLTTPATAAYIVLGFDCNPGANKKFDVTGIMLNIDVGSVIPAYSPAGNVYVSIYPTRVNYFPNPSFELASTNGTLAFTTGQYIYGPDNPHLVVTPTGPTAGDLDIRVFCNANDYTPAVDNGLMAQTGGGGFRSWSFRNLVTGILALSISSDGTTNTTVSASAAVPTTDGTDIWLRVTYQRDTGAGNYAIIFYRSPDQVTWTQIGLTRTGVTLGVPFNTTADVQIGAHASGSFFQGKIYQARALNGINGTPFIDWNATSPYHDSVGNAYNVSTTAMITDPTSLYFANTPHWLARSSARANPVAGGSHSMSITLPAGATSAEVHTVLAGLTGTGAAIVLPAFIAGDVWTFSFTIYPGQAPAGEIVVPFIRTYFKDSSVVTKTPDITSPNIGTGWAQMHVDVEVTSADALVQEPWFTCGIIFTGTPSNAPTYYVDAVSLERNSYIYQYSYFDGNSDLTSADFVWSGGVNNSASMYFPNKYIRNSRLVTTLPDFLPPLCPFSISYTLPVT